MPRVLLYGRSLFVASLQASLEAVPDLELQNVEAQIDHLEAFISGWKPNVLIFELNSPAQAPTLASLKGYPSLLLVGMDGESNQLLVLSSRPQQVLSVADLVRVIREKLPEGSYSPVEDSGDEEGVSGSS